MILIHFLDQGMNGVSPCGDTDDDSPVTADIVEVTCKECIREYFKYLETEEV